MRITATQSLISEIIHTRRSPTGEYNHLPFRRLELTIVSRSLLVMWSMMLFQHVSDYATAIVGSSGCRGMFFLVVTGMPLNRVVVVFKSFMNLCVQM